MGSTFLNFRVTPTTIEFLDILTEWLTDNPARLVRGGSVSRSTVARDALAIGIGVLQALHLGGADATAADVLLAGDGLQQLGQAAVEVVLKDRPALRRNRPASG